MNEKRRGGGISIGTTSLILIFIVLCLSVFGLLSLSSANREWKLAQKNAESVKAYYEADGLAVEFAAMVEEKLDWCLENSSDDSQYMKLAAEVLSDYYRDDSGTIQTDVNMPYGQKLHVELKPDREKKNGYQILKWNVYHSEDYQVDDSMPVWTGGTQ